MRILVTGGAGFIGSNFVYHWRRHHPNWKIRVFDALTYAGNVETLRPILSQIEFIRGDITKQDDVRRAMEGVTWVAHFAAESHVDRARFDPDRFFRTNVEGTRILLEEAQKAGVSRFHHVSTDEVYGALPLDSKERFNEETPYDPNPNNKYAVSKAEADHLVRRFQKERGMHITISNCSNNFGPFQYPEKLIPLSITNLIDGLKIPLYGDGLYVRDWIHVEDHARAIDTILQKGRPGETYLVGAENEIPNIEIAKMILELMGKDESRFHYVADRPSHDRRYAIDPGKIRRELGWEPTVTRANFKDALAETIVWYRGNESWWRPLLTLEGPVTDAEGRTLGHIGINRELGGVKFTPADTKQTIERK